MKRRSNGKVKVNGDCHGINGDIITKNGNSNVTRVDTYDDVVKIANYIKGRVKCRPNLGIICGSGLGGLAETVEDKETISYDEIDGFPVSTGFLGQNEWNTWWLVAYDRESLNTGKKNGKMVVRNKYGRITQEVKVQVEGVAKTVPGHHGRFVFGKLRDKPVVIMQGRIHFYEGYPLHKVTLPVKILKMIGVKTLFVTNAAGGINRDYNVGDIMILKDHFNIPGFSGLNPLIGPNDERFGPRFPPLSNAYDIKLRNLAKKCAKELGYSEFLREGVYSMLTGPSYETVTECRFLLQCGVDATGMSTVPEAIVATYCGMKVFGLSLITNKCIMEYDCKNFANHEEVLETAKMRSQDIQTLITKMVAEVEV